MTKLRPPAEDARAAGVGVHRRKWAVCAAWREVTDWPEPADERPERLPSGMEDAWRN